MGEAPLVSVVVPAYNALPHIEGALASACAQTYDHLEIVVVDDGSTDATADAVRTAAAHDARIRLLRQANAGVAAARNRAIEASHGAYLAPLDADDIWYPQKIERQVQAMLTEAERVGLVYAGWDLISEAGEKLGGSRAGTLARGDVSGILVYRNLIPCASAPLIRRECLDRVGLYDATLQDEGGQGCEDWDLYLRIAEHYEFAVVPDRLLAYRRVPRSMSRSSKGMEASYEAMLDRLRRRRPQLCAGVLRRSRQRFHLYLAGVCSRNGDGRGVMRHVARAAVADPLRLITQFPSLAALLNVSRLFSKALAMKPSE